MGPPWASTHQRKPNYSQLVKHLVCMVLLKWSDDQSPWWLPRKRERWPIFGLMLGQYHGRWPNTKRKLVHGTLNHGRSRSQTSLVKTLVKLGCQWSRRPGPMLVLCWASVCDADLTLNQHRRCLMIVSHGIPSTLTDAPGGIPVGSWWDQATLRVLTTRLPPEFGLKSSKVAQ